MLSLDTLNEPQRRAVTHGAGPLLVLAGAGSGKTRVITHRLAHLIRERGVEPSRIVAVTFTNKAAAEMRERVARLLGGMPPTGFIGTFHALCLRILRRDGERIGLARNFNIYDTDDQLALVRRLLKGQDSDPGDPTPRSVLSRISRAKNALETPSQLEKTAFTPERRRVAEIYARYDAALRQAQAVDFDDLLVRTLELFREHPDVAERYARRCEQLLVDEYQDTNRPQYLLIRRLSAIHGNLCVVGDEDQSIYRFRGAEIRNILEFERDHENTTTIRLEQNYRSTGTILRAAGSVIANNVQRKGKTLWTENDDGAPIELFRAPDDRHEAIWVAGRVRELEGNAGLDDMVVLYRTNAQSRLFEEIFRRERIPYQVVGSVQFYERKEIKDLLAYLKLAANPSDDVAFRRVINTPPRAIGATTQEVGERVARAMGLPLMEGAAHAVQQGLLPARSQKHLEQFLDFVADLSRRTDDQPVAELLQHLVETLDYAAYLDKVYAGLAADRMENVEALVSAAAEYDEESAGGGLQGFLDRSALVAQADEVGERPGVTLMTIHCAKGLEFPVVFLAGLEEHVFPHAMAQGTDEDLEEERRLCYVAMTRAERRLLLSLAAMRRQQGALLPHRPSRFLDEIPGELLRDVSPRGFFDADDDGFRERRGSSWASSGSSAARAATARAAASKSAPPRVPGGPPPSDGYAVGMRVLHPRFGGGRIVQREGSGKQLKLTIQFADHGQKKILPSYTKLQVEA